MSEPCKGCLTLGAMLDQIGAAIGREHWSGGSGGWTVADVIRRLRHKDAALAPPADVEAAVGRERERILGLMSYISPCQQSDSTSCAHDAWGACLEAAIRQAPRP